MMCYEAMVCREGSNSEAGLSTTPMEIMFIESVDQLMFPTNWLIYYAETRKTACRLKRNGFWRTSLLEYATIYGPILGSLQSEMAYGKGDRVLDNSEDLVPKLRKQQWWGMWVADTGVESFDSLGTVCCRYSDWGNGHK